MVLWCDRESQKETEVCDQLRERERESVRVSTWLLNLSLGESPTPPPREGRVGGQNSRTRTDSPGIPFPEPGS